MKRLPKRRQNKKKQQYTYAQTTVTKTEYLSNINKSLITISSYGYNPSQVINDWIELMFWAFQRNDPKYLEIMKRYKNDKKEGNREADLFAKSLGNLLAHMKQTNEEVLSYLYTEINPNKNIGQFFTPHSIGNLMAMLVMPKAGHICDPACGAGTCLVHAAKNMKCSDVDKSLFIGQDIDRTCVQMTSLNLMFFNLPGVIILGDTIKLEAKEVYLTKRSYVYGGSLHNDPNTKKWEHFLKSPFIVYLPKRRWK